MVTLMLVAVCHRAECVLHVHTEFVGNLKGPGYIERRQLGYGDCGPHQQYSDAVSVDCMCADVLCLNAGYGDCEPPFHQQYMYTQQPSVDDAAI